jgi:hypothetical protein
LRHFPLRQEEEFRKREADLIRRDWELQESMIRFSKFLQDNDAKRIRALKKATEETKLAEEKEKEIQDLVRIMRHLPECSLSQCMPPCPEAHHMSWCYQQRWTTK